MKRLSFTLNAFWGGSGSQGEPDRDVLRRLGASTEVKRWLGASLDKTIRLQLDPPAKVRAVSALTGPDWIRR
jgi:hypothetical protein